MPKNYSKDEVNHFFEDIKNDLTEIKVQTTKTNGRVTRLEKVALVLITVLSVLFLSNPSLSGVILKLLPVAL